MTIRLFAETPDALLRQEQPIEQAAVEYPDGQPTGWYYAEYCTRHRISYARVNGKPVRAGSFRITSCDREKGRYTGTFRLSFGEGTMTGEFRIK